MRRTLHLAPGHSAAGSFRQTFKEARLNEEVLIFLDDLSCGPIRVLAAAPRTAWWGQLYDEGFPELEPQIAAFSSRLVSSDEHFIAWVVRHSAREHAFLLAVAHELGDRPFSVVDVAEQRDPPLRHPKTEVGLPGVVSVLPPILLRTLIGTERPVRGSGSNGPESSFQLMAWQGLLVQD